MNDSIPLVLLSLPVAGVLMLVRPWNKHPNIRKLLIPILAGILVVLTFTFQTQMFLGNIPWWEVAPWKQIIVGFLILLGMAFSLLNTAIINRRLRRLAALKRGKTDEIGLEFDWWDSAQPFLFSVFTFGGVWGAVGNSPLDVASVIFAFQNGFFWQAVVGKRFKEQSTV